MGSLFHGRCWSMGLCFVRYLMCPVGKGEGFFFKKLSTFSLEIWENSFNAQFVWTAEKSAASPSSALRCKKQKVKQNLSCLLLISPGALAEWAPGGGAGGGGGWEIKPWFDASIGPQAARFSPRSLGTTVGEQALESLPSSISAAREPGSI